MELFKFEILAVLRRFYGQRMTTWSKQFKTTKSGSETVSSLSFDHLIDAINLLPPMTAGKIGKGFRLQTMLPDRHEKAVNFHLQPSAIHATIFSSLKSVHSLDPFIVYAEAIKVFPSDVSVRLKFLETLEISRSNFYAHSIHLRSVHPSFAAIREFIEDSIGCDFGTAEACAVPALNLVDGFAARVEERVRFLSKLNHDVRLPPTYVRERNEHLKFSRDPFPPVPGLIVPKNERRIKFNEIYAWNDIKKLGDVKSSNYIYALSTGLFGGLVTACDDNEIDFGTPVGIIPITNFPRWVLVADIKEFGLCPVVSERLLGTKVSIPKRNESSEEPTHWVVQWVLPSSFTLATAPEDMSIFSSAEGLLVKLKEWYIQGLDLVKSKGASAEMRDFSTRFMNLLIRVMNIPLPCCAELAQWRVKLLLFVKEVTTQALQFEPTFIGARRLHIQTLCVLGRPSEAFINICDSITLMDSSSLRFMYKTMRNF
jgi:hypothetical protein